MFPFSELLFPKSFINHPLMEIELMHEVCTFVPFSNNLKLRTIKSLYKDEQLITVDNNFPNFIIHMYSKHKIRPFRTLYIETIELLAKISETFRKTYIENKYISCCEIDQYENMPRNSIKDFEIVKRFEKLGGNGESIYCICSGKLCSDYSANCQIIRKMIKRKNNHDGRSS